MNFVIKILFSIVLLTLLTGCEVPVLGAGDVVDPGAPFSLTTIITCENATDCSDGSANGASLQISVLVATATCSTVDDATVFVAQETSGLMCFADKCYAGLNRWDPVTATGNLSIMVKVDTDGDSIFGEIGEPYYCEDAVPFVAGGSLDLDETSASGTSGWIDTP